VIFQKKEITVAYAAERCDSCQKTHRRRFREGDILFAKAGPCGCGGEFRIEMIFGETFRQ